MRNDAIKKRISFLYMILTIFVRDFRNSSISRSSCHQRWGIHYQLSRLCNRFIIHFFHTTWCFGWLVSRFRVVSQRNKFFRTPIRRRGCKWRARRIGGGNLFVFTIIRCAIVLRRLVTLAMFVLVRMLVRAFVSRGRGLSTFGLRCRR